ncbi:hypothetical protein GYMLUDRAFT_100111 [Collybiopsis luxurians FD-317 M1]|uniref:Uncharacterized protein n=1 Tax=Collybiopsis luxurians FD-317 M1 TaxID=944289 RepID=A0A0D0CHQ5_9AGAR|nr:hypothetical protein GYMLUDRAFT_100111 [Collybiopsis luxurians FD-317 M1]
MRLTLNPSATTIHSSLEPSVPPERNSRSKTPIPRPSSSRSLSYLAGSRTQSVASHSNYTAGFWSWNPEKAEMVFSRKVRNRDDDQEASSGKSPAKVGITTESPSSVGSSTLASSIEPNLSSIHCNLPTACEVDSHYPEPSLPTSSPPPLRFNSEFTGWLLPGGVDTSIIDEDFPELPDLSDSTFANTSTDSDFVPPTPHRNIGLGLNLEVQRKTKILCHDGILSETFLEETVATLKTLELNGGGLDCFVPQEVDTSANVFIDTPKPISNGLKNPSASRTSPLPSIPRTATASTKKFNMHRTIQCSEASHLQHSPDSPALIKSQASTPKLKTRAGFNRRSGSVPRFTSTSPPKLSTQLHRSMSLQRRGGRDVTISTISSALKKNSSSPTSEDASRSAVGSTRVSGEFSNCKRSSVGRSLTSVEGQRDEKGPDSSKDRHRSPSERRGRVTGARDSSIASARLPLERRRISWR